MMKYEIVDKETGEIRINLGDYVILSLYYKARHSQSPFDKEEALKLAELFVGFLENSQPASELSEDEYVSSSSEDMDDEDILGALFCGIIKG